jgi:hypothetical protein
MLSMQGRSHSLQRGAQLLRRARHTALERRDPLLLGVVEFGVSCSRLIEGAWSAALSGFDHALDVLQRDGHNVTWECNAARIGACIALEALGRWPEATQRTAAWLQEASELGNVFARTTAALFAARHDLAADDVERGRERVRDALDRWSQRGFHVQHVYAARFVAQAHMYAGEDPRALAEVLRIWPAAVRTQQLQVQLARFDLWELRGRVAISCAREAPVRRARSLRAQARRAASLLSRELRADAAPTAQLLEAALAFQCSDYDSALLQLSRAEHGFARAAMHVHAACAQHRRGELIGGDAGRELILEANTQLKERGIARPARWVRVVAPGF